jgi:hypothetical protein
MPAESQDTFDYNESNLNTFVKYLSAERLAAYISHARGDKWIAIRLYEFNTRVSEALYGVIQGLEVALRNAIHERMMTQTGKADWFESFQFEDSERKAIEEAKVSILDRPALVTPGRIVAELKFGFWVRLFSHTYDKNLWIPHLRHIFPIKFDNSRSFIHGRLVDLKTLRNRIAHHERILCGKRNVPKDYREILETIGWISPMMRNWVASTNCFEKRIAEGIPKKPKPQPVPTPENA